MGAALLNRHPPQFYSALYKHFNQIRIIRDFLTVIEANFCVFGHLFFTPAYLYKTRAWPRDIVVKPLLKKVGTVFIIFALHRKIGYRGVWAHGKAGLARKRSFPMGFTVQIDKLVSEGINLVNSVLHLRTDV